MTASDCVLRDVGGYIWAFFDARNQAWDAKITKTYVVRAETEAKKKKYITV